MFGPIKRTLRNKSTQDTKQKSCTVLAVSMLIGSRIWHLIAQKKVEFQQTK